MDIALLVKSFFDSPGPGGVIVVTVLCVAILVYIGITRWIISGGKGQDGR